MSASVWRRKTGHVQKKEKKEMYQRQDLFVYKRLPVLRISVWKTKVRLRCLVAAFDNTGHSQHFTSVAAIAKNIKILISDVNVKWAQLTAGVLALL